MVNPVVHIVLIVSKSTLKGNILVGFKFHPGILELDTHNGLRPAWSTKKA